MNRPVFDPSIAVIPYDVIGRLSLVYDKRHFLSGCAHRNELRDVSKKLESEILADYYKVFPHFLSDLTALVEAIVLSDKISFVKGVTSSDTESSHKTDSVGDKLDSVYCTANELLRRHHPFIQLTQFAINAVVAPQLSDFIDENVETNEIYSNERNYSDICRLFDLAKYGSLDIHRLISNQKIDFDYLHELEMAISSEDEIERYVSEEEYVLFLKFLRNYLGDEWIEFEDVVGKTLTNCMGELFYSTCQRNAIGVEISKLSFMFTMYVSFQESVCSGGFVHPSWGVSEYLVDYRSKSNKYSNIKDMLLKKYPDELYKELSEMGVYSYDLLVPQIFRMSINGANSIDEVILNAFKIKNEKWAVDFRKSMYDCFLEEDDRKLLKKLKNVESYITSSLNSNSLVLGNITLSSSGMGSAGFSLGKAMNEYKAKHNPVIVFHENISFGSASGNYFKDLEKIFYVPRSVVSKYYSNNES